MIRHFSLTSGCPKGRGLQRLALSAFFFRREDLAIGSTAVLTTFFTDCLTAALVAALVAFFAVFAAAEEAFAVAFLAASFALVPASCATPLRMRAAVGVLMPAAVSPSRLPCEFWPRWSSPRP